MNTVTYTSNSPYSNPIDLDHENIQLTTYKPTKKAGYVTDEDFFEIFRNAYESTFGSKYRNHPGDMYINSSVVLEIVCNTLNALVDLEHGRQVRNVKEI